MGIEFVGEIGVMSLPQVMLDCANTNTFIWLLYFYPCTGLEIVIQWSPVRPNIEHWLLNFQNWSPAGDSQFV